MKRRFVACALALLLAASGPSALAHPGGTDSNLGHKDKKNASGLGGYHYHCGGYPAHLHMGFACPYLAGLISSDSPPRYGVANASSVSILSMPAVGAVEIALLEDSGESLVVLSESDGWLEILLEDGSSGFVPASQIDFLKMK